MVAMKVRAPRFSDEYDKVKEYASDMEVGWQGTGYLCPFCKGGSTGKDKSLSITRELISVKWICHRDSCRSQGTVLMVPHKEGPSAAMQQTPLKVAKSVYAKDLISPSVQRLSDLQVDYLWNKYGLNRSDVERATWLWDNHHNRMWMPIHKPDHTRFTGHVLKAMDRSVANKSLTMIIDPLTIAADWWYRFVNSTTLVVVEDSISACKIARQFNSLALLGTRLGDALVAEIKKYKFRRIVMMLDKDAFQTALDHEAKYSELFEEFKVIQPEADPKYLSDETIKQLVENK